jgi:Uma2 family endonuclease
LAQTDIINLYSDFDTMVTQIEKRQYTRDEYLALEATADYKSEYRDGKIIPMAGGTTNHNRIAGNLYVNFRLALQEYNYEIFIGDVRLWIPHYNIYTYPDIMIISEQPIYEGKGTTTVTNPLIIIEVLSSSTSNYDKGKKFRYYRSIPSFKEYILIDQYSYFVEHFSKTENNKWLLTEYETEDARLVFNFIDLTISLQDIYARVDFYLEEDNN